MPEPENWSDDACAANTGVIRTAKTVCNPELAPGPTWMSGGRGGPCENGSATFRTIHRRNPVSRHRRVPSCSDGKVQTTKGMALAASFPNEEATIDRAPSRCLTCLAV